MKHFTTSRVAASGAVLLPMQVEGVLRGDLEDCLRGRKIVSASVPKAQSLSFSWFALIELVDGRAVELSASSTEVGNWIEYATINVEVAASVAQIDAPLINIQMLDFEVSSIELLVVNEGALKIEAGVVIRSVDSREIIAVARDIPGSFSIILPGDSAWPDSQFPKEQYIRVPVRDVD
jgi:hypothetical protein